MFLNETPDKQPVAIFFVCNFFCFIFYLAPVGIYSSALPVLAFDTTSSGSHVSEVQTEKLVVNEPLNLSDNKSLVFVGDIMLARHVEYLMDIHGHNYPFSDSHFLTEVPALIIGNFEASIPLEHKKTPNYNFQFSVDRENLQGLVESGFTHLSLANNHALDYGRDGYENSRLVLSDIGLTTFGQPKSLGENTIRYVSTSNTTYALIGLNMTQMDLNQATLTPYMKEAEENSEVQIVYIHWGEEYTPVPNEAQRTTARMLSEAGVDIIIGHHSHVIQSIEKINNTLVFYSLGNYIFDQYFSREVMEGLAIRLTRINDDVKITLIPHSSAESQAQPKRMEGERRSTILTKIAEYSDKNIAEMIVSGELSTPLSLATSTEIAIMNP